MSLLSGVRTIDLMAEIDQDLRPITELEKFFVRELQHATWEMESVRLNAQNTAAESRLHAIYSRASRNWRRARNELRRLQSIRVGHATRYTPETQELARQTPLADPFRVPMPKETNPTYAQQEEK